MSEPITATQIMEGRRMWEAEFFKFIQERFEPWQRSLLLHLRFQRVSGNWPMTDLPDGSEC